MYSCCRATWGGERGGGGEGRRRRGRGRTGQRLVHAGVWSPPLSKIDRSTERGPARPWRRSTGSVSLDFYSISVSFYLNVMYLLPVLFTVWWYTLHNSPQSELHSVAALRWSAVEGRGGGLCYSRKRININCLDRKIQTASSSNRSQTRTRRATWKCPQANTSQMEI